MTEISPKPENKDQKKKVMQLIKKNQVGGLIIMKGDYALTENGLESFKRIAMCLF
jgi:hypothetical protein